jgi:hypothetical protein
MRLSPFSFSGADHPLNPMLKQRLNRKEYTLTAQSRLVKNPMQENGASSLEKAFTFWGLIANKRPWSANGRSWSALPPTRPFIPARKSGAFWLFHVTHRGIAKLRLDSKKGIKRTPEHCKEFDVLCWAVSTKNGMYYSLLKRFLLSTKNNEERHLLNDFTGTVWKC